MKTQLLRASLVAVLAAASAFAQSSTSLKVNVPFDFIVGNQTLHAGQYTVDRGTAPGAVILKSAQGKGAAIAMGQALESITSRNNGRLVFHRYGAAYFLSEVWGAGNHGRKLPTSSREREMAAKVSPPQNAILAAAR